MGRIYAGLRTYACIDLKSFYASVECSDRKLDPLKTNLVVADPARTDKTICLAVSPSLKAYGISGRARLFEVIQRVKEVNAGRFRKAQRSGLLIRGEDGRDHFNATSFDADALASDPSLELSYIVAPPRMKRYEKVSTEIFSIYMRHVSPDDIHVYSIDECFMDVTPYIRNDNISAHELVLRMIREVLKETGITATAGIGTNLYLAKIAMDIVAKHVPADKDGVRIAELDERSYREKLWSHEKLTDFWRIGHGIEKRLSALGCRSMGDVARVSIRHEDILYSIFGASADGRGFAVSGGVASAVVNCVHDLYPDREVKTAGANGLEECRKLLALAKAGKYDGYLLEGMACPGGCVAGAGTVQPIAKSTAAVKHQKEISTHQHSTESNYTELLTGLEEGLFDAPDGD